MGPNKDMKKADFKVVFCDFPVHHFPFFRLDSVSPADCQRYAECVCDIIAEETVRRIATAFPARLEAVSQRSGA